MKYLFSLIIFISSFSKVFGQCISTSMVSYNASTIIKDGSNATVTFTADNSKTPNDCCYKLYLWDFGDGTALTGQNVQPTDNYSVITHTFDLNNSNIVSNGNLQVTVKLTVNIYRDVTTGNNCQLNGCYIDNKYVTYAIPQSNLSAALYVDPIYNKYPINIPVILSFKITTTNYSATDNLTYSLQKAGIEIMTGQILASDLNVKKSLYSGNLTTTGATVFDFVVKRYGSVVGSATPLVLNVNNNPDDGGMASCLCNNYRPCLDVTYTNSKGVIDFTIKDCSSPAFILFYADCATYGLQVVGPPGESHVFKNEKYPYPGFGTLSNVYKPREPDVYEGPKNYSFIFDVSCKDAIGNNFVNEVRIPVTIQPHVFDPSENSIEISPENQFSVDENWEDHSRMAQIRLFADGNYDKCLDIENGVQKAYRTIQVTQLSKLIKINPEAAENVPVPLQNMPPNTKYVLFQTLDWSQPGSGNQSEKKYFYFNVDDYIPLDVLKTQKIGYTINVTYYDESHNIISTTSFQEYPYYCYNWNINQAKTFFNTYDLVVYKTTDPSVTINSNFIPVNKSLTLFNGNEIDLTEGFEIQEGAFFEAAISDYCSLKSSRPDVLDQTLPDSALSLFAKDTLINATGTHSKILIYPNPNDGSFIIDNQTPDIPLKSAELFNEQGTVVKIISPVSNLQSVNVSAGAGVYILRICTSKETIYRKVIIY
jgi:hypothetical protein